MPLAVDTFRPGALAPPATPRRWSGRGRISFPVVAGSVRLLDLMLLGTAGLLAAAMVSPGNVTLPALVGAAATNLALSRNGAYTQAALLSPVQACRGGIKPLVIGFFLLVACLFMAGAETIQVRLFPLSWAVCAGLLLIAIRLPTAALLRQWARAGRLARKVAVIGIGDFSREFIARLDREPQSWDVIGLFDDRLSRVPPEQDGVKVLGTVAELVARSRAEKIDVIVVALPLAAVDRISRILDQLASTVADIVLTTDLAGLRFTRSQFGAVGGNPVVSVKEAPLKDWRAVEKAVLDYGLSPVALLIAAPLLLAVALLIKLDSPGPVLFRQPRLGFNNRMFTCLKFRSMRQEATDLLADRQTMRDDPRVTRVGRVIRKLSIDELPQLFNVLGGTMSLVGPRPHAPNTRAADRLFTDVVQQYALRHRVKPGITGWAQVNGWRGETSSEEDIAQRVACDLYYIENWSVGFDLRIMWMTFWREVLRPTAF